MKTDSNEKIYKLYANGVKKLLNKAKKDYFTTTFSTRSQSIKSLWQGINQFCNRKSSKKDSLKIDSLSFNGRTSIDDQDIANNLNDFFSTVGSDLVSSFTVNDDYKNYLPPSNLNSFFFHEIKAAELLAELLSLKDKKSMGPDSLSPFLVKVARNFILKPLLHIFNRAAIVGCFPDKLKQSKVMPIFKKGAKNICTNYRPITLSCTLSKIFEKIIHKRLISFINANNYLFDYQFGFRKNYSTSLALMEVCNMIQQEISNNKYILGIFLDLQKAFDTVSHSILFHKLFNMGIRGNMLNLVKSFLTGRTIFTFVNGVCSSERPITCGLPQGSVISPLLFLCYINDLHRALPRNQLRLFADDSNVFTISDSIASLFHKSNEAFADTQKWLNANRLTLNASKTNFVIFFPSQSTNETIENLHLTLTINGQAIKRSESVKFLGLNINENLNWGEHINGVCKHVALHSGIFYKYKYYIDPSVAKMLYFSFVYSKVLYGIEMYGRSTNKALKPLQVACNRALRTLQNKAHLYPTKLLYRNFGTLPVRGLNKFRLCTLMYNCIHNPTCVPPVIKSLLHRNRDIHKYSTRNMNDFNFSLCSKFHHDPIFFGSHLWNKLPLVLKQTDKISTFKRKLIDLFQCQDDTYI